MAKARDRASEVARRKEHVRRKELRALYEEGLAKRSKGDVRKGIGKGMAPKYIPKTNAPMSKVGPESHGFKKMLGSYPFNQHQKGKQPLQRGMPHSGPGVMRGVPDNRAIVLRSEHKDAVARVRLLVGKGKRTAAETAEMEKLLKELKIRMGGTGTQRVAARLLKGPLKSAEKLARGEGAILGKAGKGLAGLLKQSIKHPVMGALGAATGAAMVGGPLLKGLGGMLGIGMEEEGGQLRELQRAQRFERKRQQEMQRLMGVNTSRLLTMEPHLAQQILAGRRLPQGAVVLGGKPRTDLLAQVAEGMSRGEYAGEEAGGLGGLM